MHEEDGYGYLRALNITDNPFGYDVWLDGKKIDTDRMYLDFTDYRALAAGSHKISITKHKSKEIISEKDVWIAPYKVYTLLYKISYTPTEEDLLEAEKEAEKQTNKKSKKLTTKNKTDSSKETPSTTTTQKPRITYKTPKEKKRERKLAEKAKQQAEKEKKKAEKEQLKIEKAKQKAEKEKLKLEKEKQKAEEKAKKKLQKKLGVAPAVDTSTTEAIDTNATASTNISATTDNTINNLNTSASISLDTNTTANTSTDNISLATQITESNNTSDKTEKEKTIKLKSTYNIKVHPNYNNANKFVNHELKIDFFLIPETKKRMPENSFLIRVLDATEEGLTGTRLSFGENVIPIFKGYKHFAPSPYLAFTPGTYDITIYDPDTDEIIKELPNQTFKPDRFYTIIITGPEPHQAHITVDGTSFLQFPDI